MDVAILKTLIPLALTAIGGLIAIVRLQSKVAENTKQLDMLLKDVGRLEKESEVTVTLVAKMEQAERNVTVCGMQTIKCCPSWSVTAIA